MSQSLSQIAAQVMRQEQRLTPQLIQSMDILQLPLMALETRINQELERNPILEYEPQEGEALPEPAEGRAEEEADGDDLDSLMEELSRRSAAGEGVAGDRRWRQEERDAKMEAIASASSRPVSLQEYLLQQWSFVDAPREVKRAGEFLINYIEEDGYLRTPLEPIGEGLGPAGSRASLEAALRLVQQLDPPGVGARDLRECLLIQLRGLPERDPVAEQLVEDHLEDLEKNRYPVIARATGQSMERIKEAVGVIGKLQPRPGLLVAERPVPRVVPDVIVSCGEGGQKYTVQLARENWPRLRISPVYQRMLEQRRGDKPTREFIRKNLEAAKAIMEAIRYRWDRLLEVSKAVVAKQRDFLDHGPQHLKVLRMSDLAAQMGCDPSTISRTVDEKYMQTPRGIYPLRYFFTGGTETPEGQSLSWDAIKAKLQEIIEGEDKSNPLCDEAIVELLKKEGVDVSRRTIAKYRAQLHIPPARRRVEY